MKTLLLRLEGPLQSWGYRSRFRDRDTGNEPTKSGVIGLLCCALGRDRSEPVEDLARLVMHVRELREGRLLSDFQTAGAGHFRGSTRYFAPKAGGGRGDDPVLITKRYLQNACFLVALAGEDSLIERLGQAVQDPVWPLSLGRRSCPPSAHVFAGISEEDPLAALRSYDAQPDETGDRLILESLDGESRSDVPISWSSTFDRRYAMRTVRIEKL